MDIVADEWCSHTDTAFRQQRLKAWQPILTPKTVLPIFFAIGIIFAPIGGLLLYASSQVQELKIDYSSCNTDAPYSADEFEAMPTSNVEATFKSTNTTINALWRRENTTYTYRGNYAVENVVKCTIQFTIPEDMNPPVLFYYSLSNFYQNHRRYVNSFYDKQLKGTVVSESDVSNSECTPLTTNNSLPYYPCGLIANSLFNDTFASPLWLTTGKGTDNETYIMQDSSNIAWDSDKALYGKYPDSMDLSSVLPPPNWQKQYPGGKYTTEVPPPDLSTDQHFMVWMRTAGLPTFSKLYMRNDTSPMKFGTYSIDILSEFPVTEYQGTKSLIITTRTVIGGKNPFLGIAYVVVGGICIVLGAVFTVTHLIKPRKLGDHTYLSWNKVSNNAKANPSGPAMGMSTGRDMA
ncbi:CDC50/LEM3 family [Xylariales sp. PMI_506]|nr:CDC50/LEM3 family [Xylariales sp. PMI_506]